MSDKAKSTSDVAAKVGRAAGKQAARSAKKWSKPSQFRSNLHSLRPIAVAVILLGAGFAALMAPSADMTGSANPKHPMSSDEASVELPVYVAPNDWVSGGAVTEPVERPCPTVPVSAWGEVKSSATSFTSLSGSQAVVHTGVGDTAASVVVDQIISSAPMCPPWLSGEVEVMVTEVAPLDGVSGVALAYSTSAGDVLESVWIADGPNLLGITSNASDVEWASLIDAGVKSLGIELGAS